MFSKNKKTNSKIRFQQTGFRQRLQSARQHKHQGVKGPGWGKLWPKILVGVILAGLLYLIYVPNFLFIKNINVTGISAAGQQQIIDLVGNYTKTKPLQAQGNWLFLNKNNLASYILQRDEDITGTPAINKKFPHTLNIAVTARTTAFNVTTPLQQLLVTNDGLVKQDITGLGTSTLTQAAGLVNLTIDSASSTIIGVKYLPDSLTTAINQIYNLTKNQLKLTVDHFEVANLQTQDISEYATLGFKLMFNSGTDLGQAMNQAQLLLNSLADSQQKNLYYIDMRFQGKAYVCYKNTACVEDAPIVNVPPPAGGATTTPQ